MTIAYQYNRTWRSKNRVKVNRSRKQNYLLGNFGDGTRREWTTAEDDRVLAHTVPDRELARALGRSVQAIQVRRCRIRDSKEDT